MFKWMVKYMKLKEYIKIILLIIIQIVPLQKTELRFAMLLLFSIAQFASKKMKCYLK